MNKQHILNELNRYFKEYGKSPTFRSFAKAKTYPAPATVVQCFGTWNVALTEAKLPLRQNRFATPYLLEWLRTFKHKKNRLPTHREIPGGIRQAMCTAFGSVRGAFKYRGKITNINENTLPSKKELQKAVNVFIKKHHYNPSISDITKLGYKKFHFTMHGGITNFWSKKYPSTSIYTTYATYIANDGHKCLSKSELLIDNFLSEYKIPHEKEINYAHDKKLNSKGNLRCDFLINDVYVEFAGIWNNKKYTARLKRKQRIAKKMKKTLVILYINDIFTNGQRNDKRMLSLLVPK